MKITIVIPAYKPQLLLLSYIDALNEHLNSDILVVNDGSGEFYDDIFSAISQKPNCTVMHHHQNRGKGAAIKTAVQYLIQHPGKSDGIITADADGQHSVEDVVRMSHRLCERRDDLVLGVRTFDDSNTPARSLLGNRIASTTMRLLYGIKLGDTQTGLRAVGKKHFAWLMTLAGNRYEYEMNMLVGTKNIGLPISTIPIKTLYFDNNSGSHFNTIKDGARVFAHLVKGLFKYIGNSLITAAVDISVFTVLFYLTDDILSAVAGTTFAALIARILSSVVDFKLNRSTFASKSITSKRAYFKYYTLWLLQLAVSTILVNVTNLAFGAAQALIKPVIDATLAVISYKVQLHWVFAAEKKLDDVNFLHEAVAIK